MKQILKALLILTAFTALQVNAENESYTANLDDIAIQRDAMKESARGKANREREVPSWKGYLISTKQAMDNTQRLYYQIDELRYKNQLVEERWGDSSYVDDAAEAAQVHYLDLLNVVSARLSIDKANNKKSFTQQGEKDRALGKLNWAKKFLGYVEGMSKFEDMDFSGTYYQQTDLDTTFKNARDQIARAQKHYTKAANAVEAFSERKILERYNRDIAKADRFYQGYVDAKTEFNESHTLVTELLDDGWIIDQKTFNYILPCDADKTPGVAIIVHGTNIAALVEEQEDGSFKSTHDVSVVFPDMMSKCIAIAVPKSGMSETAPFNGGIEYYRQWWMADKTPRTEDDEIKATIDLINLAFDALPEAHIYLVYGYDAGVLASHVIDRLKSDPNENVFKIYGHVTVNYQTGVYTGHDLDGTTWSSTDM
ncbi:secreted protein [methanotrophic bacterial endosymbiont of Bathymodiolus sp.]|nr:secreted protein [methanotrophic bacterial endosymbiont of Bathymodiolus sp.]